MRTRVLLHQSENLESNKTIRDIIWKTHYSGLRFSGYKYNNIISGFMTQAYIVY